MAQEVTEQVSEEHGWLHVWQHLWSGKPVDLNSPGERIMSYAGAILVMLVLGGVLRHSKELPDTTSRSIFEELCVLCLIWTIGTADNQYRGNTRHNLAAWLGLLAAVILGMFLF